MSFNLIVSQGRAADKTAYTLIGAALTATAIQSRYGVAANSVGEMGHAPAEDDWTVSLPQAATTLTAIAGAVEASVVSGKMTVLCSNTCSISLATLPVVARHHPDAVILWVDAHGDFNTPSTTNSGYLGGMVVAAACGLWESGHGAGLKAENLVFVGARDIDPEERILIEESGARIMTSEAFDLDELMAMIGDRKIWIHVDWDVLEPGYVEADYKVSGGLLPDQVQEILRAAGPGAVLGIEVAEYQARRGEAAAAETIKTILGVLSPLLDRVETHGT